MATIKHAIGQSLLKDEMLRLFACRTLASNARSEPECTPKTIGATLSRVETRLEAAMICAGDLECLCISAGAVRQRICASSCANRNSRDVRKIAGGHSSRD